MKIVQLSDLHLTAGGEALFGSSPRERLELAIDSILQNHADADFCLLTGDLADAGSDAAYASLAQTLKRLPMPAHLLPGNHDSRAALRRQFPQLPADGDFMQAAFDTPAMKQYAAGFPPALVARDQLPYAKAELSTHDNQRVTKALNDGLQAALTGAKTPEQAMKDAQREAERLLRSFK